MRNGSAVPTTRRWTDHVLTYLAEALVMVATIAVYKIAAMRFGEDGFNIYAVVRRTTSFIVPFAMMGLAVAVVRSVAMAGSEAERWAIARTAGILILALGALLLLLFTLLPADLAFLIFGDRSEAAYSFPIGAMVVGQLMHALLYSYWRGSLQMKISNVLQVINLAIVPIVAFVLADSLSSVLQLTAGLWIFFTVVPFLYLLVKNSGMKAPGGQMRGLLRYGLPRVPGDLALAALLSLPVYFVNHVEGVESGGQVAFGLTLLNLTGALFAPISLLMLPSVSHALAKSDHRSVIQEVVRTRNYTLVIAAAMVVIFQIVAAPALQWYLGTTSPGLIIAARILFSGALFYALYIALRSLLDAYFVKARNSSNILLSLALFLIGAVIYLFLWPRLEFLLVMVPVSLFLLAVLTWREVHKILDHLDRSGTVDVSVEAK